MDEDLEQTFLLKLLINGQKAYENMLNITDHQRNANQNQSKIISTGEDIEKCYIHTMENSMHVFRKLNKELPCGSAVGPRGTPKTTESSPQKRCLFTHVHRSMVHNSQGWRQPKCPSTDEQMN